MKASEYRESLAQSGISPEKIDEMVKANLAKGILEDDELRQLDASVVDQHLEAVAKSMGEGHDDGDLDLDDDDGDYLYKGTSYDDDDDLEDEGADAMMQVVETIAKGADKILGETRSQHTALAKAFTALGQHSKEMVKAHNALAARIDRFETQFLGRLEDIAKAIKAPVPPRAVANDVQAIPHPGEIAKGGNDGQTVGDVLNKALTRLKSTSDRNEVERLKSGIAQLEMPGANHTAIANALGLS